MERQYSNDANQICLISALFILKLPIPIQYLHTQLDVCKNPLTRLCPFTLAGVSWPVPFFRKHTEFLLGTVGENITHVAPTQPGNVAHESKQASKLLCVEFDTSIL